MLVLYISYDPSPLLVTQYLCKGVTFGRHWFETTDVLLVILFDICDSKPYAIAKFIFDTVNIRK